MIAKHVSWIAAVSFVAACGRGEYEYENSGANSGEQDSLDAEAIIEAEATPTPAPPSMDELGAFSSVVHPLLVARCKSCHETGVTPFFAQADATTAKKTVEDASKVYLDSPALSRLYLRLAQDRHQCWSDCAQNAEEMLGALTSWSEARPKPENTVTLTTESLALNATETERRDSQVAGTHVFEAESATLVAPMVATADAARSGGRFIEVPEANRATSQSNAQGIGRATFTVNVEQAGTYFLFARIQAPTQNANAFYFRVDAGAFATWNTAVTNAEWQWQRVNDAANANLSFNLTAGAHTVEVRQRDDGTRLDIVALSTNAMFTGADPDREYDVPVLKFDLATADPSCNGQLVIDAVDFDEFSYRFENPRIEIGSGSVNVSQLLILINGVEDKQARTYELLSATVNAPGSVLSGASMIAPKQQGREGDKIQFKFGKLSCSATKE
jgi:hypothetical protein